MDCRNISDATKMATELYSYMAHVPFMAKFVIFAKRSDNNEAKLRVFCMTDDKEDKTLEQQEHFTEVAKSRDIEVCEGRNIYLEFAGNIVQVLKSGEQLNMKFSAFKENRLAFNVRIKETEDNIGRIIFMNEPKVAKGEPAQTPLCTLNFELPDKCGDTESHSEVDISSSDKLNHKFTTNFFITKHEDILRADIRVSDISELLGGDWEKLGRELDVPQSDLELIKSEYPNDKKQQGVVLLRLWLRQAGPKATGNELANALYRINRGDIVDRCITDTELVTDDYEKEKAKRQLITNGKGDIVDTNQVNGSYVHPEEPVPQGNHTHYFLCHLRTNSNPFQKFSTKSL